MSLSGQSRSAQGSPPQVRGKPVQCSDFAKLCRITPAGAGKTVEEGEKQNETEDHPRRCGENPHERLQEAVDYGSPPQVRGKQSRPLFLNRYRRITPAGAGKTVRIARHDNSGGDHPRRCGENSTIVYLRPCVAGSPPQVRGKHTTKHLHRLRPGITPAGAGKTPGFGRSDRKQQDHPRRCGENSLKTNDPKEVAGSPPQVRGKPEFIAEHLKHDRITPAGAGKTVRGNRLPVCARDHPRRCGENTGCRMVLHSGRRITPAGAGKTDLQAMRFRKHEDHPRRCGENTHFSNKRTGNIGSPPQVRGKPREPVEDAEPRGITPAGAGKTYVVRLQILLM